MHNPSPHDTVAHAFTTTSANQSALPRRQQHDHAASTDAPSLRIPGRDTNHTPALSGRTDAPTRRGAPSPSKPSPSKPSPSKTQPEDLCDAIRAQLVGTLGANRVRRYLNAGTRLRLLESGALEIAAGDSFTLDMIQRRLGDAIRIAAQFAMATTDPAIRYTIDPALHATGPHANAAGEPQARRTHPMATRVDAQTRAHADAAARSQSKTHTRHPPCPTLEHFIVGSSNRLAFESVRQIVESTGSHPPVFVHGSCGVGKTHLLRGATAHARRMRPGCKVRYTTGEAFTNAFVTAIRTRTIETFQKKYRGLDLLCIDDIHLMAGKQATQHELLQIFNTLSLGGARIILASDAHPREIARLDQALASRFAAGLVVRVDDPDPELGKRLVTHIAHKRGMFLDTAAVSVITQRVGIGRGASVRDLEGAVLQIQAVARLLDKGDTHARSGTGASGSISPSMNHVRQALSLRSGDGDPVATGPIALDTIISSICSEMTVTRQDLHGKGRQKKVVLARELIVHIARTVTSRSFPEIAHAIGRPNHSTVITAAKRFKDRLIATDPISVGCPHDGLPPAELTQLLISRIVQC